MRSIARGGCCGQVRVRLVCRASVRNPRVPSLVHFRGGGSPPWRFCWSSRCFSLRRLWALLSCGARASCERHVRSSRNEAGEREFAFTGAVVCGRLRWSPRIARPSRGWPSIARRASARSRRCAARAVHRGRSTRRDRAGWPVARTCSSRSVGGGGTLTARPRTLRPVGRRAGVTGLRRRAVCRVARRRGDGPSRS